MQSSQPLRRSTQNNLVDDHRACPHTLPGWGAALRHFRATTADSLVRSGELNWFRKARDETRSQVRGAVDEAETTQRLNQGVPPP